MCVNCDKTNELLVFLWRIPPDIPAITIKEQTIERVTSTTMIHGKAAQRLCLMKRAGVECIHIVRIYTCHMSSHSWTMPAKCGLYEYRKQPITTKLPKTT